MINTYFFDETFSVANNVNIYSHHIIHINTKIPLHRKNIFAKTVINKIVKQMANKYARIINQNTFKCQTLFRARFDKQDECDQKLNEIERYKKMNNNQTSTKSTFDKFNFRLLSERQTKNRKMKN